MAGAAATSGLVVAEAFHYRYHPLAARTGRDRRTPASWGRSATSRSPSRRRCPSAGTSGTASTSPGARSWTWAVTRSACCGSWPAASRRWSSARAKLSSPGVDRAMRAGLNLPGGGTARSTARCSPRRCWPPTPRWTARPGKLRVFNPFAPQLLHRLRVRTDAAGRPGRAPDPRAHVRLPAPGLRRSRGRRRRRSSPRPRTPSRTWRVIDDIYRAAGLEPAGPRPDGGRRGGRTPTRWPGRSQAALEAATALGASHAEVRVERSAPRSWPCATGGSRRRPTTPRSASGLRVVHDGSIGFAATVAVDPDAAAAAGRPGGGGGPATAAGRRRRSSWPPSRPTATSGGLAHRTDPVDRPLADKVALLGDWSRPAPRRPGGRPRHRLVLAVAEDKYYADLAGTVAIQRRVRVHPQLEAWPWSRRRDFEKMRTVAPPVGRGWEYLEGDGLGLGGRAGRACPSCWPRSWRAPSVEAGPYDLVIDPTNLWLTIHESIGHATELDRALGYEAAYAGTSFATLDKLGTLRYGSAGHARHRGPHGRARAGHRGHRRRGGRGPVLRPGARRRCWSATSSTGPSPPPPALGRSNGCAFADSPLHVPIQRMANVSLPPGPGRGPDHRGADRRRRAGHLHRGRQELVDRHAALQLPVHRAAVLPHRPRPAWPASCATSPTRPPPPSSGARWTAVGGRSTYLLAGAFNCGKGQPGQVAPVSHGCPSALVARRARAQHQQESGR